MSAKTKPAHARVVPQASDEAASHRESSAGVAKRGLRPRLLTVSYAVCVFAPLGFAWYYNANTGHAPIDVVASAFGMVAFSALLVEFLFSGRTRWISGHIGAGRTMRLHRRLAYAIIACIVIHPFLYTAPDGVSWPWFNAADPTLVLSHGSLFSGLAAWVLTASIILIAVDHNKLPGSYQVWRLMHAGSAIMVGVLIAIHAISAGGYSSRPGLAAFWLVLLFSAIVTLFEMFVVQPRRKRQARLQP